MASVKKPGNSNPLPGFHESSQTLQNPSCVQYLPFLLQWKSKLHLRSDTKDIQAAECEWERSFSDWKLVL